MSWNHDYQHPRTYSIAQSESGRVSESDAAGRVFCTFADGNYVLLWTQNAGHLLAELAGNCSCASTRTSTPSRCSPSRAAPAPILFVRRSERGGELEPESQMTRYGWSRA